MNHWPRLATTLASAVLPLAGLAQDGAGWRACTALTDAGARLACFDRWAQPLQAPPATAWQAPAAQASTTPPSAPPPPVAATADDEPGTGCRGGSASTLSRFWELEDASDCGTLRFRGYRPISVSVAQGSSINRQPTSSNPQNSAARPIDYRRTEMRVQLSVRTKLAQNLLTDAQGARRDSLWVGYTQQSYWQLFSPTLSRPFRTTDHEPEIVYIYPATAPLPWGGRLRYAGIGLVHQSNGQSLPLSRSWNRAYLMAGAEWEDRWALTARLWQRLSESARNDDNPHISDYIGRAELGLRWNASAEQTLTLTLRHALRERARGSWRLEWMHNLGSAHSNLRLHAQLFSGYGDSLVDFNRRRTVFSLGLSLVDF